MLNVGTRSHCPRDVGGTIVDNGPTKIDPYKLLVIGVAREQVLDYLNLQSA